MLLFRSAPCRYSARGKGNKLISIPSARVKAREEFMVMAAIILQGNMSPCLPASAS